MKILHAIADYYEETQAGKTGRATKDVFINFEKLLKMAGCAKDDARTIAERELRQLDGKLLQLEFAHKRDKSDILQIRFSPAKERELYILLKRPSPTEKRQQLEKQFIQAAQNADVPAQWQSHWKTFCQSFAKAASNGDSLQPFDRNDTEEIEELLVLLPKLLAWPDKTEGSLVRFASCQLCRDQNSKRLQELADCKGKGEFEGKLRGRLGQLLEKITEGKIRTLDDLGILANPRFALVHGPLRLRFGNDWLDLGILHGPCRISIRDIERAEKIETTARRCLTVENETSFHELAKLQSGEILIQTSYPGSATVKLLQKLPSHLEFHHFGDSDKDGFTILESLRKKTERGFRPLHMECGRIPFEQEARGIPRREWPFYD